MKIRDVSLNNRRKEFVVSTYTGITYSFPFVKAEPRPDAEHPVAKVFVDKELANEAITNFFSLTCTYALINNLRYAKIKHKNATKPITPISSTI